MGEPARGRDVHLGIGTKVHRYGEKQGKQASKWVPDRRGGAVHSCMESQLSRMQLSLAETLYAGYAAVARHRWEKSLES